MPRRALAAVVAPVLALGLSAAASALISPAGAAGPDPDASLPAVHPAPQSMQALDLRIPLGDSVDVVAGPDSDPSAVAAVQQLLASAGVANVYRTNRPATGPGDPAIYVGGPDENPAASGVPAALGVRDASGLPSGGYVLADGHIQGRPVILLDGVDGAGTFYAAQTLRQLLEGPAGNPQVAGVRVRDWPDEPVRGVIEGFYGTPWSDAQRLQQMDFYGAHKMNTYVYSPKNDPYLRDQWREPYPSDKLAVLKTLVARATANHVQFTYALSPGLSVCYSSQADEQALVEKFQSLWDIGVRTFSIPLDDISYTNWNCSADQQKFGTGGAAAGAAQSYLLNEVQKDFIDTHTGASPLEMVPTEYSDVADSPYKQAIRQDLSPKVIVGWTGVGVIAPTITGAQAQQAKDVYGHDILLWDNYPVNDYVTNRLLLGPYAGRSTDLGSNLYGITANPMIQPEASKIALAGVGDYTWNAAAFDPQASWQAAITELAGGDPQARQALAAFADLEYYSQIDPVQAPALARLTATFWKAWEAGQTNAAAPLDSYLQVIENAGSTLAARMNDPEFVAEAQPWLDSAHDWGAAARAALQMLVDERAGNGAAALADRAEAEADRAKAQAHTYAGLGGTVKVTVGDGVIDTFVASALAENDRWLGVAGRHVLATTSMPTYQTYDPQNMVDGDPSTFFWSSRSPSSGDYVGVDLGTVTPISTVHIQAGDANSPSDYLHSAALEYSTDGTTWMTAGTYANSPDITATLPAGTSARYVRLRATAADGEWVKVHEFTVTGPADQTLTVSGTPAPASGSSLAAAADGNVDTAYTAAASPQNGDALVVALPKARPLAAVGIAGTGQGELQARVDGSWQALGRLSPSGYTESAGHGVNADALRIVWDAGSPAPSVAEVVPWYADVPSPALTLTPDAVDTSVGSSSQVALTVTAARPDDAAGTLTAAAPAGVRVDPAAQSLRVDRGSQQSLTLTVQGQSPGTYSVPITFTPESGAAVTRAVQVVVHPAVSSTDVAAAAQGATATASSVEEGLAQFTPDHAIDGDDTTRWSSDHTDDQWLQVHFASPQNLGKVVIHWETAHARSYQLQVSTDGSTWTTVDDVTDAPGGTETDWVDASGVSYLRMRGVSRATAYGYSIYELRAYPLA